MAESVAFYQALGFVASVGGPDAPFTTYPVGDGFLNVQLDRAHAPVPAIWGRVVFWVDDVDALHARAARTRVRALDRAVRRAVG